MISTAVAVPGPSQSDTSITPLSMDIGGQILIKLMSIDNRIGSLGGRVCLTETALAKRTTSLAFPSSPTAHDYVATPKLSESGIIPSA